MNPNVVSGSWLRGWELNPLPQDYEPRVQTVTLPRGISVLILALRSEYVKL